MLAWRYRLVRAPVFGVASTLYIIPSLALFAILGPITGFVLLHHGGDRAGRLHAAHPDLEHRGRARRRTRRTPARRRRRWATPRPPRSIRVDLPLALPYIFAGLRVATATVIGLVTVTALIGLGGLGQQITYGFNIAYNTPIIVGLVLSIALAAVADLLLVGAQRLVVPWARTRRAPGAADMSFLAQVFGWFTTSANWTGPQGIPLLFWHQLSSRWPWWSPPSCSAAGSAWCSATPGAAGWSRSTPPTPSGPCPRWPS